MYIGGDDYATDSVMLTFNADNPRNCFNVSIIDNDLYELRESFFVNLTTTAPLVELAPMFTVVMIDDEDSKCWKDQESGAGIVYVALM